MAKSRRRDFDDDDDFEDRRRPRRRSPESGRNTAVKIVAILGGVFVALALVCGGVIYYMVYSVKKTADRTQDAFREDFNKQVEQQRKDFNKEVERQRLKIENSDRNTSHQAANAFLQEVNGGRVDAAYQMTTADYQRRVSREQFEEFLATHADALRRVHSFLPGVGPDTGATFTYTEKALVGTGFTDVTVTVVKDGPGWKVDQFKVGP